MTFDITIGNAHSSMNLVELLLAVLLIGGFISLIILSIRRGVLTLLKKPVNARPCALFWTKVDAKVLDNAEGEVWHEFLLNDIKGRSGIPNQPRGQMRKVSNFKVEYTYQDKQYQKFVYIKDFSGDAFELYCLRWNPERTKTYVPTYEWSKGSGISMLFFGILMLLIGVIVICGLFS